jgi:hypothetical protein
MIGEVPRIGLDEWGRGADCPPRESRLYIWGFGKRSRQLHSRRTGELRSKPTHIISILS